MDKQTEFVLRTMEERDVRFVRLWFTDVLGFLKSVAIAPAELESALAEGVGFDAPPSRDSRGCSSPTWWPAQILRRSSCFLAGETGGTARMFCDIRLPTGPRPSPIRGTCSSAPPRKPPTWGSPSTPTPRSSSTCSDAVGAGRASVPVDTDGYFDHTTASAGTDFRRTVIETLEQMGIPVEFSHHEAGPGQQEIDLRHADALTTADNIMTFRVIVKEVAVMKNPVRLVHAETVLRASRIGDAHPPLALRGGHERFLRRGRRVPAERHSQQFVAGLLHHAPEISAVTNQWVNSYKRLAGGQEAPSYVTWGQNNRSAMVRVPMFKPNRPDAARVELRTLDSAANPYLAFALVLAAGLSGIEQGLELPEGAEDEMWSLTPRQRLALGIRPLPRNLEAAISEMEGSELVAETLGEHVFDYILANKRAEYEEHLRQVTPLELGTLLPRL